MKAIFIPTFVSHLIKKKYIYHRKHAKNMKKRNVRGTCINNEVITSQDFCLPSISDAFLTSKSIFRRATFSRSIENNKYVISLFAINRGPRSSMNPGNVWCEKIMIAVPAWLFADYISSMASWRVGGKGKRVNEVYVNNEGEEMNTSECCSASANGGCNARWRDPKIIPSSITPAEAVECPTGRPIIVKPPSTSRLGFQAGEKRRRSYAKSICVSTRDGSFPVNGSRMPFRHENRSDSHRVHDVTGWTLYFIEYFALEDPCTLAFNLEGH